MYIKEIEIQNFKSFGKKVKIPFFKDFTVISGPNGSGKSNIIDAILFALGLSNSRVLRAEKLTDLIFNADGGKKNFAQVTIKFDNTDRRMPVDSDEIVISRKVRKTESGYYSYYYFNDKAVTLADIHNYLSKAGISPEGYNVIIQGDVTRIIEMSVTERRKIIDEIAGVAEFDEKKEQAFNELEVVRQRIERVDVILSEVDEQLIRLKQERDQALKYQSLRDEKRRYEGYILLARLKDARKEFERVRGEIQDQENRKEELAKQLEELQHEISKIEHELSNLNSLITQKGEDEQIALRKQIETIKGEISLCSNTIELAENEIKGIEAQKKKTLMEIKQTQERVSELEEKLKEESLRKENILNEINDKNSQLLLIKSKIAEVDAEFAETQEKLAEAKQKLENLKNEKNELIREEERLLDAIKRKSSEVEEKEREIQDSLSKIESADSDADNLKDRIEELNAKKQELIEDRKSLENSRLKIKQEIAQLDETLIKLQQEYARSEAFVKVAEEMNYSEAVEAILKAKHTKELPGIYGTIAQLGKVNKKYSLALEIAAGARMQSVVVDNDEDAARAINYLKEHGLGRVTFLPLNKMQKRHVLPEVIGEGVIDYAINLVDYDKKFDPAFWYVFRDTLVVENLSSARKLMGNKRMVTLEGELIEKSGAMTGGMVRSRLSFAIREEENLTKIAEKIAEYEGKRRATLNKLEKFERHLESITTSLVDLNNEIRSMEMQMDEIRSRGVRLSKLIETRKKEIQEIEKEITEIKKRRNDIEESKNKKDEEISTLIKEIDNLEQVMKDSKIPELIADVKRIEEEIHRLEGILRDTETKVNAITIDMKYAQSKIEGEKERIADLDKKKMEYIEKINEMHERIQTLKSDLEAKMAREKELSHELEELQNRRAEVEKQHSSLKEKFEDVRRVVTDMERNLLALHSTKDALNEQIIQLDNQIAELGLSLDEEIPSSDAIASRIAALQRAMEKLEPVNMRAIDEYNEVENRKNELKSRRDTLFREREEIIARIKKYDEMKKEAFMNTFNSINEHFKKIFAELSDGSGELFLENPDDPFSGGMTIKARPSGKNLQRLEAMSGGEKSLTALSLLFAIQQYKPAPFYVLDEVDMFLDGVNVERVAKRIQKSANNAQFIVVSLRKPMIEAAKRTIGVAMQENNISSITGIKLN